MHIEIDEKRFGDVTVLRSVSLDVEPGETVAVIGPSGVGKTTMLRIVAGLDTAFAGTVPSTERLAMVFQSPTLLPWRTAEQNLCLTTGISASAARRLLQEVGLGDKETMFPDQLSLGQQRRLSLARALAADPTLLLLDEPFVSLDAETAQRMQNLTRRLLDDRAIATLLVTHDLDEAAALADRVVALRGHPATIVGNQRIAAHRNDRTPGADTEALRALLDGAHDGDLN